MTAAVHLVDDADLVALVDLACLNPIRTVREQEALLRLCTSIDNDFVNWTGHAIATWEARRCTCGRAIPVTVDNCGDCTKENAA